MRSIFRAIEHIENNLAQEITINQLAEVSFISPFHMARVFKYVTGYSPMEYVRNRRLTEAAKLLLNGNEPVLNIALEVGYGSHSAFTKAFTKRFGVSPKDFRHSDLFEEKSVEMITNLHATNMESLSPRIIERVNLTIVGQKGDEKNASILSEWMATMMLMEGRIKHVAIPHLCQVIWSRHHEQENAYDIFAGYAVYGVEDLPQALEVYPIKSEKIAVFEYTGNTESLINFTISIYGEWFPNSGYQLNDKDFTHIQFIEPSEETDGLLPADERIFNWEIWCPIK